jgi:glutamate racemase
MKQLNSMPAGPIGVFDSGYGGLTILRQIREQLPGYDFLYLGDNARAPYGPHSFDVVYRYTLQAVEALFARGCSLVILACNTASAKALRTIQQCDLERIDASRRVLGVIRPTVEAVGNITHSRHVGVLATTGTINSDSYTLEIQKLFPDICVSGLACPMWVPLVENNEYDSLGADYFVKDRLDRILQSDPEIDTLILACTHYPLLLKKIKRYVPEGVNLMPQGEYVAASLADYLQRHPEMEQRLSQNGHRQFYTTIDDTPEFDRHASLFFADNVKSEYVDVREGC